MSVYIDPKMTGENVDDLASKRGSAKKKKKKTENDKNKEDVPKPPESEFSALSDTMKTESEGEVKQEEEGKEDEEDGETKGPSRKQPVKLVSVDRSKFGKFIVEYGELEWK